MQRCLDRLEELAVREPRMRRAVTNVGADCRCDGNPHGNIPLAVQTAMASDCAAVELQRAEDFAAVFARRRAIAERTHYPEAPPPAELRRCVSLTVFAAYHLVPNGCFDERASARYFEEEYPGPGPHRVEIVALGGSTGRPAHPCWWTWHTDKIGPPRDGKTYLDELAVGEGKANGEGEVNWSRPIDRVVEIRLRPADLGVPLYKPTALDDFRADSRFAPDRTGASHGWTCPDREGLCPRPELVSSPVDYVSLSPPDGVVEVTVYPYQVPGALS